MSLPHSYQRNIAALFSQSAETMVRLSIPASLAEEWLIIKEYLTEASLSINHWLDSHPQPVQPERIPPPEIDRCPPAVIRFDLLAELATSGGANRLEQAALAVQECVGTLSPAWLTDYERSLLRMVMSGMHIDDMASELNYSERSIYRQLKKVWWSLDAHDRDEGLHKLKTKGMIK